MDCEISLNTHFLLDFGDFDKSFSLGNAHASLALRSLNHVFIVHEALVLVPTFIILEKLFNRLDLEKTGTTLILGKVFLRLSYRGYFREAQTARTGMPLYRELYQISCSFH